MGKKFKLNVIAENHKVFLEWECHICKEVHYDLFHPSQINQSFKCKCGATISFTIVKKFFGKKEIPI